MPELHSITEANKALLPFVPLVAQMTGSDTTLDRIRPLMDLCGNPQNRTRVVHIAGTSGKTSTAYFMAALLRAAGKRVGLTVSPHVDSVTERVQIDGQPLTDDVFCKYLGEFLDIVATAPAKPSYFELLYAFSFWVFEREGVDYAVIETGMGGLHDATNIASRNDKLCIITDIGFDHMHILGHTIAEITAQKIGIVHAHNPVVMYQQSDEVSEVVDAWVAAQQATLFTTSEAQERGTVGAAFDSRMPAFQQRNWLLAHAAYRFLCQRDGLPELSPDVLARTQEIQVPGRMDVRQIGNKTIIMDGAHNGQKMQTFLRSFGQAYPGVKPALMVALKQGKEPDDVVPLLANTAASVIVTTFDTSQDLPAKSIDPHELAAMFTAAGAKQVIVEPHHTAAYARLLSGPEAVCVVTGSFYLLSQVRESEQQG